MTSEGALVIVWEVDQKEGKLEAQNLGDDSGWLDERQRGSELNCRAGVDLGAARVSGRSGQNSPGVPRLSQWPVESF